MASFDQPGVLEDVLYGTVSITIYKRTAVDHEEREDMLPLAFIAHSAFEQPS